MKSDGYPTYHLANVIDDHLMQISHVLRGAVSYYYTHVFIWGLNLYMVILAHLIFDQQHFFCNVVIEIISRFLECLKKVETEFVLNLIGYTRYACLMSGNYLPSWAHWCGFSSNLTWFVPPQKVKQRPSHRKKNHCAQLMVWNSQTNRYYSFLCEINKKAVKVQSNHYASNTWFFM